MDTRPIGVFDSGIGGLTVLKELEERLPYENFVYLGDNLNFPYGEKSKEDIIKFSQKNINYLIKQNVKMVIIACGTATSQALEEMKKIFDIPIIGIIKPTVEYIKSKKIRKVGVIGTLGTIRSGAWEKFLKEEIPNLQVINRACPVLATIAEEERCYSKESIEAIHEYMEIFKLNKVNTIILGCTHYPIYKELITEEFEYDVTLINTGVAVSKYVSKFLEKKDMQNSGLKLKTKIIITKSEIDFDKKAKNILKSLKYIDITNFY